MALGALLLPGAALGSGFALREDSAAFGGAADSGSVSSGEGLATVTTNPAGMTALDGDAADLGTSYILPRSTVHVTSASSVLAPGLPAVPIRGEDGRNPFEDKLLPSFYAVVSPTKDLRLGLGVDTPFGLATSYSADAYGRYQALVSDIRSVDINPSAAYRVTDWLSVGGGLQVEEMTVKLSQAVDFGALAPLGDLQALGGSLSPQQQAALLGSALAGSGQPANDGRSALRGSAWATGWDLGLVVQPDAATRLGLSYRSGLDEHLHGDASFAVPAQYQPIVVASGAFKATGFGGDVPLPGNVWAGVSERVAADLTLHASYQWTDWSRFKSVSVAFDNPAQAPVTLNEHYRDSSFAALGATWRWDERLTLRSGVAWDQTPTRDGWRDLRVPDSDRYWLATGATYPLSDSVDLNGSYIHVFFAGAPVAHAGILDTVAASAAIDADVFTASLTLHL